MSRFLLAGRKDLRGLEIHFFSFSLFYRIFLSVIISSKRYVGLAGFLLLSLSAEIKAQQVQIKETRLVNQQIEISYDLLDEDINRRYTLRLYSSEDNFIKPLEQVTGDIGIDISVGGNKKLIWDVGAEMGPDFKGNISLEIKGQVYVPFITLDGFEDYKSFVRGKSYEVIWAGGRGDHVLVFDFYKGENKVHTIPNVANVGHYTMQVPKKIKPGSEYLLKISDSKNNDDVIYTDAFKIRRKIPLGAQMLAGAAIIGGAVLLFQGEDEPEEIPDPLMPER